MQIRRAGLVFVVFGLITLLVIGAINLASQDKKEESQPQPVTEQSTQANNEPSTAENLKVENQTGDTSQSSAAADNGSLPSTGPNDFLAPIGLATLLIVAAAYSRSRQLVRRSLLS